MHRPVIGIATQTLPPVPGERPPCWIMGHRYVEALRETGAVPWLIPLLPHDPATMLEIFNRLDGVFLTGGVDVDPSCYGEPKTILCGTTDPDRDAIELRLLQYALEKHLPIFAVCRGIQILNVALGGTLYQDLNAEVPGTFKHDYFPTVHSPNRAYLAHEVIVSSGTKLSVILGEQVVPVNSMHHQAIKTLGQGLVANAYAPDGIIEGVEGTNDQYMMAVQWHPEELSLRHTGMRRLFTHFISAATRS